MAFFELFVKARRLRKARELYEYERSQSIELSKGKKIDYTIGQKIRRKKIILKRKVRGFIKSCPCLPENSWLREKYLLLKTEGTLENYILKSICGFLGGILLTYLFFVFFVFQLHFSLTSATLICSFIGTVLTVGLAFSPRVRCIVFLFLPQFFSKRGRQALMAYAFILALTGPVKNSLHNVGVLSESLSCGQDQLREAVRSIVELVKQPFYALRDSLTKIVKSIKGIVTRIKRTLISMKRLVLSILRVIKSAFDWLGSIVNICNKKLGTPYDRCQGVFEGAVADCRAKLGPIIGGICSMTYVASIVCYALKPLDLMCILVSYLSDAIVGAVRKSIKKFTREMRAMFYVKIKFSHSFHMETNKSKSFNQISTGISTEVKTKINRLFGIFDFIGFVTSFFFLFLLLRVIYYRYKWLRSDRFDNCYVTSYLREIDIKRARQDKETIFPLNKRERQKYVALSSILLARSERRKMAKSVVFLGMTTIKLAIYVTIDYCIFWILDTIRFHGRTETSVLRPSYAGAVKIEGRGFLADIYRSIVRAFSPYDDESEIDTIPCLPDPKPPDYDIYAQLLIIVILCWFMAIFEPYGLRLRSIVLSNYYPDRAKQRAVWLYNHIIRSRGTFVKYARRQLRRKFGTAHDDGIDRVTLRQRIWSVFPVLNRIFPMKPDDGCLICGEPDRDKSAPHVRCPTPGCVGIYCTECFKDLQNLCTICLSPLDYGDLTDVSEERDSSDDPESRLKKVKFQERDTIKEIKFAKEGEVPSKEIDLEANVTSATTTDDESSKYSYSYQNEPDNRSAIPEKLSFKDVEAQKIRDDATIQIFNEPLPDDASTSSEKVVLCFGFNKQKKPKKSIVCSEDIDQLELMSIADTESWVTEECDGSVIDVEIEDFNDEEHSSDELLLYEYNKKTRQRQSSLFKRFFANFKRIFSFKKRKDKCLKLKSNKDLMKTGKDSDESFTSGNYEMVQLLKKGNYLSKDNSILRKRNLKNTDECSCKSRSFKKRKKSHSKLNKTYMNFKTKDIPRHMKSICNTMKYYEIDESSSCRSPSEKIQYNSDFSMMTDTRSSVDSDPSRERRSATSDVDNDSYIYTSDNNEHRYESRCTTSNSSIPDDYNISDVSTDSSVTKRSLKIDNNLNDIGILNEEDKINEDSDEKGQDSKRRGSKKVQTLISTNPKSEYKIQNETMKESKEKYKKEVKRAFAKMFRINKTSDFLKRNKVDKENANAKKKYSLSQSQIDLSNYSNVDIDDQR